MSSLEFIRDRPLLVCLARNLAHPARYRKDHSGRRVTARYLRQQFDVVEICRDWLVAHNNKALLQSLKPEGID